MSYGGEYYDPSLAVQSAADARTSFIRRTYLHLAGAVLVFMALETVLVNLVETEPAARQAMLSFFGSRLSWLLVFGGFIVVGWVARMWAHSSVSPAVQYLGLGLYVLAETVIFLPILYVADTYFANQHVIPVAGLITLTTFAGLTIGVLFTRRDFSFLGPILGMLSLGALGLIIASMIFGFGLGLVFCFAMVALVCGWILYTTSNVIHHYRTNQHVAAALELFAAVATLFWYVLQIVMSTSRR